MASISDVANISSIASLLFSLITLVIVASFNSKLKKLKKKQYLLTNLVQYRKSLVTNAHSLPSDTLTKIKANISSIKREYVRWPNFRLRKYVREVEGLHEITVENVQELVDTLQLIGLEIEGR